MSSKGGAGEKTEKPTPKRKKEARKEGQVPRTQDVGGWLSLLVVGLAIGPLAGWELRELRTLMAGTLAAIEDPSVPLALQLVGDGAQHAFLVVLVLASAVMVVSVLGTLAQGGLYVAPKLLKPKLSKLDPLQGAKRIFGFHALWEGTKTLIKSVVVGLVAWGAIKGVMPLIGGLVPIDTVLRHTSDQLISLFRNVAIAGLVMAAADYAVQYRKIDKQTRMSKEEIKQEHKQAEGDPLVKSAIRSRQLAAARNRMIADVADADVLLVNPTHVAVAIKYDAQRGAPRIVARGAGAIAAKIREAAVEARVPLVRDVPLARALYRTTEVGQEIPRELWAAVAQVLAYVITRRKHGQHGGEHRTPRAEHTLPEVLPAGRRRPNASTAERPGR